MQSESLIAPPDPAVTAPSDSSALLDTTEPNQDPAGPTTQEHGYSYHGPPRDRLSTLPAELLAEIFELVRLKSRPSEMPRVISKSLLYYTDGVLYHQVSFNSLPRLQRFLSIISPEGDEPGAKDRGRHLASLVKIFIADFGMELDWANWLAFDALKLFASFVNVGTVTLSYCPPLLNALVSNSCASQSVQSLRTLRLFGGAEEKLNLFLTERLGFLNMYQALDTLELYFSSFTTGYLNMSLSSLEVQRPVHCALRVKTLKLNVHGKTPSIADITTFLSYFPFLDVFILRDDSSVQSPQMSFYEVFCRVTPNLSRIELSTNTGEPEVLGDIWTRFANLKLLKLTFRQYSRNALLSVLDCKALVTLHLAPYSLRYDLPVSALNELMFNRACPPGLTVLKIDVLGSREGRPFESWRTLWADPKSCGWMLPQWTDMFTFDDGVKLVAEAAKVGIRVTGRILKDIEIQKKWYMGIELIKKRIEKENVSGGGLSGESVEE